MLVIIGMFAHDGFVVGWLCSLLKGLFGYGFWVCAPVFVLAAVILGFHKGRPVAWRTTAALLLPMMVGALADILLSNIVVENVDGFGTVLKTLYGGGIAMKCGGVIGGLLAFVLQKAFSIYGAAIILFLAFAYFILAALNISIRNIIEWLGSREPARYEPEQEKKPEPESRAKALEESDEDEKARAKTAKRRAIDIPMDDEPTFGKKGAAKESPR